MTVERAGQTHRSELATRRGRLAFFCAGLLAFTAAGCGPQNPETFNVPNGKGVERFVKFESGAKVQIWVESEKDSDVDLFVFDASGKKIAVDEGDSKNCHVAFTPESAQKYKIQVVNRTRLEPNLTHRNVDNRCTLKWEPK